MFSYIVTTRSEIVKFNALVQLTPFNSDVVHTGRVCDNVLTGSDDNSIAIDFINIYSCSSLMTLNWCRPISVMGWPC